MLKLLTLCHSHWAPLSNNWGSDRQWSWLGQALRIATEIRIDKEANETTVERYSSITEVSEGSVELFIKDRRRTLSLLFVAELS